MARPLIIAHQLSKSFPGRDLFINISFGIEEGERVGLIGPNGAGKSTLLKMMLGLESPDRGDLSLARNLKLAYLEQNPTFAPGATVMSTLLEGALDVHDWKEIQRAEKWIVDLEFEELQSGNADTLVATLSGGWKKRLALARELMRGPQLLLLDEPTNHLDVEGIIWLEEIISSGQFATLTITHDRAFLQKISTRIIELDRRHKDGLLSVKGDYASYLQIRESLMLAQEKEESSLKNTLRRETEWLRRGAKARTTKQQARIQRAEDLKKVVSELSARNKEQTVKLAFQSADKNSKILINAKEISKQYNGVEIIPMLDLVITFKTRLGLLGRNGCGKSTLIQMLAGKLVTDTGLIKKSDNLEIAWFEQNRESLDQNLTLAQTISPDGDHVDYQGNRIHIRSYLNRFLFDSDQIDRPVHRLSGGEQARLLLAKLMLTRANLLILDEPTNDLDMATLDVLANVLNDFPGAVILVTHDRFFLDQVANHILAFGLDGDGKKDLQTFTGLEQWEAWHELQRELEKTIAKSTNTELPIAPPPSVIGNTPKSKVEQQIQQKEKQIEELRQEVLQLAANDKRLEMLTKKISSLEKQVEELIEKI